MLYILQHATTSIVLAKIGDFGTFFVKNGIFVLTLLLWYATIRIVGTHKTNEKHIKRGQAKRQRQQIVKLKG